MGWRNKSWARDPHWITAKLACRCAKCGTDVAKGARGFYYPSSRQVYCAGENCGAQAARDFDAARSDEAAYQGGY